ncbi:hypothetical protein AURDEDRAFT_174883 [Auricularia subglabra TFB-10046 SS5]|nr:hypothetical protein AURDEDRAFT_174883 [Auricularia subglabra TFB-10046 SS5]
MIHSSIAALLSRAEWLDLPAPVVSPLLSRAEWLDLPALIMRCVLPLITQFVEHFRKSEVALCGTGLERHLTHSEELDLLLRSRYPGRGTPLCSTRRAEPMGNDTGLRLLPKSQSTLAGELHAREVQKT